MLHDFRLSIKIMISFWAFGKVISLSSVYYDNIVWNTSFSYNKWMFWVEWMSFYWLYTFVHLKLVLKLIFRTKRVLEKQLIVLEFPGKVLEFEDEISVWTMSRSQDDLEAKSCPNHNFIIWSRILKLFHRNDDHFETMCCMQDLHLEGQCHSITLEQKRVRPITLLF